MDLQVCLSDAIARMAPVPAEAAPILCRAHDWRRNAKTKGTREAFAIERRHWKRDRISLTPKGRATAQPGIAITHPARGLIRFRLVLSKARSADCISLILIGAREWSGSGWSLGDPSAPWSPRWTYAVRMRAGGGYFACTRALLMPTSWTSEAFRIRLAQIRRYLVRLALLPVPKL